MCSVLVFNRIENSKRRCFVIIVTHAKCFPVVIDFINVNVPITVKRKTQTNI